MRPLYLLLLVLVSLGLVHADDTSPKGTIVKSLAFSPDGKWLVAASWLEAEAKESGFVTVWEVSSGKLLFSRKEAMGFPVAAFSGDGKRLAVGSFTDKALVVDTGAWKLERELSGHGKAARSVAFAADGRTLATASADSTVVLWDLSDPARPTQSVEQLDTGSPAGAVAFAPAGNTLAVGTADGTVALWDLTDLERPARLGRPLAGPGGAVTSVAFAPDRRTVAAGTADGGTARWDLLPLENLRAHALTRACALAGAGLSRAEWAHFIPDLPYQDTCRP